MSPVPCAPSPRGQMGGQQRALKPSARTAARLEDAGCALGHSVNLLWAGCNESAAGDSNGANRNLLLLWRKLVPR